MIDVHGSDQLKAVVLAMKQVDRALAKDIRTATVATMNPVWKSRVKALAMTKRDTRILEAGTRIAGGNPPAALAGTSTRRLRGGGRPADLAAAQEFGSKSRNRKRTYSTTSRRGTPYRVSRRTHATLPASRPAGRVIYPALSEVGPRMVSLWVQLVVRKVYDATQARG